jgi:integrase
MPLSDAKIRNLRATDKPYKVADFDGLFLLVKPSGTKSWRFKYRFAGKEKLMVFGDYPAITLAQARQARDAARSHVANGIDPGDVRKQKAFLESEARAQTFEKVAATYLAKITKEGRAAATLAKYDWLLGMVNADIGRKPIAEISAPMVLRCLRKVEAKGNYETARKMRSMIGSIFRYGIATGVAEQDPTYALKGALIRPKVTPRSAITDRKALGGLMRAIDGFHGQPGTRIALQLLAIVACRPGELRHATWAEFDLDQGLWSIPGERMKMRRPHRVPLPAQAMVLLRELESLRGGSALLFPSLRTSMAPMSENTLNVALRRLGYSGSEMTAHGFRATFSTLANESGLWHPDAIERALAHLEANEVRRAYARGEHWDERVRMADWWAGVLDEVRVL